MQMEPKKPQRKVPIPPLSVKYTEFSQEMQEDAVAQSAYALSLMEKGELKYYWEVAKIVKEYFDQQYGGAWHVIVGQSFGSFVTNEVKKLTYFMLTNISFLVFQHG